MKILSSTILALLLAWAVACGGADTEAEPVETAETSGDDTDELMDEAADDGEDADLEPEGLEEAVDEADDAVDDLPE